MDKKAAKKNVGTTVKIGPTQADSIVNVEEYNQ